MFIGLLMACVDSIDTLCLQLLYIDKMVPVVGTSSMSVICAQIAGPVVPNPHAVLFLPPRDRSKRVFVGTRSSWWEVFHAEASRRSFLPAWPHPLLEALVTRAGSVFDLRLSPSQLGARRKLRLCLHANACVH